MNWLLAVFLCLFSFAYGAENNECITLPAGAIHQGDYFAAGSSIEIQRTIIGDAFITGGQIFIHGEIDGDLIIMGGSVDVAGLIKGNIRILGGQITVNGRVERNARCWEVMFNYTHRLQFSAIWSALQAIVISMPQYLDKLC